MSNYIDLPVEGEGSGVSSLNSLTGGITLVAGSNVTITPSGNNLTIASSGGGGSGANQNLSNLLAPTAVNVPIIMSGNALDGDSAAGNWAVWNAAPGSGNLSLNSNSSGTPGFTQIADASAFLMGDVNALTAALPQYQSYDSTIPAPFYIALDGTSNLAGANSAGIGIDVYGSYGNFVSGCTGGTVASPTMLGNNNALFEFYFCEYAGTSPSDQISGKILINATEARTGSNFGTRMQFQTTPNGTTSRVNSLVLVGDQAQFPDGSSTVPSLAFQSATNTGMYHDTTANNGVGLSANGSAALVLTGAGDILFPSIMPSNGRMWFGSNPTTSVTPSLGLGGSSTRVLFETPTSGYFLITANSGVSQLLIQSQGPSVKGNFAITPTAVLDTNYIVLNTDCIIYYDTLTTSRTVSLPASSSYDVSGALVTIKDGAGSAGTNYIVISPNGSDTIDGSNSSINISTNYGVVRLINDGSSKWFTI